MARIHYWGFIVNVEGQPIEGADISLYLAGTDTPILIYNDEFSPNSTDTDPQTTSTTNGYFEVWIPDSNEGGYNTTQKFKLSWEKTGIASGFIDYVDVFSTSVAVNETDSVDITKDKSVSNKLAYLWEAHRLDNDHVVHGIDEVNELDPINTIKNKLMNNSLAFDWNKHKSLTFATSGASGDTLVVGTSATSADYPHGIKPLKVSDNILITDSEYWRTNRVISHNDGKKWDDHVNSPTGHGISPVDENDTDTTKNKLVSNFLMNTNHSETVLSHNWSLSGSNYIIDVLHDLITDYPVVQLYDTDTKLQVTPVSVKSMSNSTIRVENTTQINAEIIILK